MQALEPILESMQAKGVFLSMHYPEDTSGEAAVRRFGWELELDTTMCRAILDAWWEANRKERVEMTPGGAS